MKCSEIKVIKKDGTREDFNVQKVVIAVNKSANRAMIQFSEAETQFICRFVEEKAEDLGLAEEMPTRLFTLKNSFLLSIILAKFIKNTSFPCKCIRKKR